MMLCYLNFYNKFVQQLSSHELQATSHTTLRARVTITLQALSLVEKAEPVQVHFTLRLRDQRSEYVNARWM